MVSDTTGSPFRSAKRPAINARTTVTAPTTNMAVNSCVEVNNPPIAGADITPIPIAGTVNTNPSAPPSIKWDSSGLVLVFFDTRFQIDFSQCFPVQRVAPFAVQKDQPSRPK
jgi:hypothetical protein